MAEEEGGCLEGNVGDELPYLLQPLPGEPTGGSYSNCFAYSLGIPTKQEYLQKKTILSQESYTSNQDFGAVLF